MNIQLLLYLAFAICELLAACGVGGRVNLVALGLFFFSLTFIVRG